MKKLIATLMALCMMFAAIAMAESPEFTLRNGITFGMNMEDVIAAEASRHYEIDHENTRGGVRFTELEYEHVTENNIRAELKYLFAGNELAAVRLDYETRDISYTQMKDELTAKYGEPVQDLTALGNGIYAVDDDGRLKNQTEAWRSGNVMIVLEHDRDDLEVTYVNLAAGYIR